MLVLKKGNLYVGVEGHLTENPFQAIICSASQQIPYILQTEYTIIQVNVNFNYRIDEQKMNYALERAETVIKEKARARARAVVKGL